MCPKAAAALTAGTKQSFDRLKKLTAPSPGPHRLRTKSCTYRLLTQLPGLDKQSTSAERNQLTAPADQYLTLLCLLQCLPLQRATQASELSIRSDRNWGCGSEGSGSSRFSSQLKPVREHSRWWGRTLGSKV